MLDVGFSEILLTSAIALIVLGPERLPKVARQVGNWMGRARAMARQLTEQLEREVSAEELLKEQNKTANPKTSAARSPIADMYPQTIAPVPPEASAQPPLAPPPPAAPGSYSSDTAATPHGADWHPAPPASKPDNG
jgi:sec-independent protein translocase protein TatB